MNTADAYAGGAVNREVVHRCPACSGRHSIWAKGDFRKGTLLEVLCAECGKWFEFSDGVTRVIAKGTRTDFVACHWRDERRKKSGDGRAWECRTPLAAGTIGRGSTVEMKCRRCHRFIVFYR